MVPTSKTTRLRSALLLSVAFALGVMPQTALPQSAAEVTPPDFSPGLRALEGSVQFDGQPGTEAPAGAESIGIRLSGVQIRGGFDEMAEAHDALQTRLTRDRIPVSELFEATADLEAAYAREGFVLARAVLPVQSLEDGGVLTIEVIDGFIEAVNTDGVPENARAHVARLTEGLVDRPRLPQRILEKQVLLAGGTPGLALNSALSAGQKPGSTLLTLEGDFKRFAGFVSANNSLPDTLGTAALNAGFEVNGALKRGEVFYGRISTSARDLANDDVPYRAVAAGFVFPIGTQGFTVNYEYATSQTTPLDQITATRSAFDRSALRLSYPVVRTRERTITASFTLDRVSDNQELISGIPVYADELTVARLGMSMDRNAGSYSLRASGTASFGLDVLGAKSRASSVGGVPLGRAGSDNDFSKLNFSMSYGRALTDRWALQVTAEGQANGGEPLPGSEMFTIGGPGLVSGVDGSDARGDSGYVVRAEVSTQLEPSFLGGSVLLNPYFFAAGGKVNIEIPTAVEQPEVTARAIGFGVDLFREGATQFNALSGNLEVSFKDASNGSRDTTFGVSLSQRF